MAVGGRGLKRLDRRLTGTLASTASIVGSFLSSPDGFSKTCRVSLAENTSVPIVAHSRLCVYPSSDVKQYAFWRMKMLVSTNCIGLALHLLNYVLSMFFDGDIV